MRVGDFFEIDLIGIDLFHAAVFDGDDMVVENHATVLLEFFDDLIQAGFVEIAH